MAIPALQAIFPVCIPRGAARNYTLIAEDILFDDNNKVTSRVPTDLSNAVVHWVLYDPDSGKTIVELTSASVPQVEILSPQTLGDPNRGRSTLKLTSAITDISPGVYEHESWVDLADGRRDTIVDRSSFTVQKVNKRWA